MDDYPMSDHLNIVSILEDTIHLPDIVFCLYIENKQTGHLAEVIGNPALGWVCSAWNSNGEIDWDYGTTYASDAASIAIDLLKVAQDHNLNTAVITTKYLDGFLVDNESWCETVPEEIFDASPKPSNSNLSGATKDNGTRHRYPSGFIKEHNDSKLRVDLVHIPSLRRVAQRFTDGALKYGERNYLRADLSDDDQVARFKAAALRHVLSWMEDESDEDHFAGAVCSLFMLEELRALHG